MPLAVPEAEDLSFPLPAFGFFVSIDLPALARIDAAMRGGFTDVSGLEATMEPKAIAEGGRNYGTVQRPGRVTFGTVVLKRGVIESRHLWQWWSLFAGGDGRRNGGWAPASRCDVVIAMMRSRKPVVGWRLKKAMPVKFRVGDLNARGTELAVEELHLVHEGLNMEAPA
jgi:phage tail-like protein